VKSGAGSFAKVGDMNKNRQIESSAKRTGNLVIIVIEPQKWPLKRRDILVTNSTHNVSVFCSFYSYCAVVPA